MIARHPPGHCCGDPYPPTPNLPRRPSLLQACVKFYRDALLVEDFAMLNYTAVIKLLKKRDKLAGTSDQRGFMAEVMANQPFAM